MKVKSITEVVRKKLVNGTLPDIDSDFPSQSRAKVKAYIEERFGEQQVCSVGSYTTMKIKGAIKDLFRIVSSDFQEVNLVTSIIDGGNNGSGDKTMLDLIKRASYEPRLKQFIKANSDIFYMLPSILNQPKTKSIHPCAMIVFPKVMSSEEWAPMRVQQGQMVSEWSGYEMDGAGFLKNDILGIRQLDKFTGILDLIKSNGKELPDIYNLPQEDEVYRYFTNGWNSDIFQLSSAGLTDYSKKLKPNAINDLVAAVAVFRPGPMKSHYHEIYVKCKNEGRLPTFLWGTEDITKETYGLLIYQEQIMQVFQQIAGLTMKEADDIRRAMGKLKLDAILKWKDTAEKGFLAKGCSKEDFDNVWNAVVEFAKYGFNKCVSGDEKIYTIERHGVRKHKMKPTIKEMFLMQEETLWAQKNLPNYKKMHNGLQDGSYGSSYSLAQYGEAKINKIKIIRFEGVRDLYKLTLVNGESIEVTANHKFPTSNGNKRLDQLRVGFDKIYFLKHSDARVTEARYYDRVDIASIEYSRTDECFDVEMHNPFHTFTLESGICTCNSHSVAYALTGYVSQYLKVFYPIEFWTVALSYADEKDTLDYLSEIIQAKKIKVRAPDINKSEVNMTSEQETSTIFWGLGSIKGIGEDTALQIIDERKKRPYISLVDFVERHTFTGSKVKKQTYEGLIASGCFDLLYDHAGKEELRGELIEMYRGLKKVKLTAVQIQKDIYTNGQIDERWWWQLQQKNLTGLALIGYEEIADTYGFESKFCTPLEFNQRQDRDLFRAFGGYVVECKVGRSKNGKYARVTVENNYKQIKLLIWSDEYAKFEDELKNCEKKLIIFEGSLRYDEKWSKANQFTLKEESNLIVL